MSTTLTHDVAKLFHNKRTRQISASMVAFVEVVKALSKHAHTRMELREVSGLSNGTTVELLRLMRTRNLIFIKKWKRTSERGNWMEAFMLGDEEDAPKPKPLTLRQVKERHKIKQRLAQQGVRNVAEATEGE